MRLWLDRGGVYAIAGTRGGAEFGERWHTDGALTHKDNVFDDFLAAARTLVAERDTSPNRLATRGGSNVGLLMGRGSRRRRDSFATSSRAPAAPGPAHPTRPRGPRLIR